MKYMVITEDGERFTRTADTYSEALDDVGPEGWNRVQLTRDLAAWVNDCGLIMPDKYRRNVLGGVLLICFGAQQIPYAGPIVLTGWDARLTLAGEAEVIGLTEVQVGVLRLLHEWVGIAIDSQGDDAGPQLRLLADLVRNGGVPGWTVYSS